MFNVFNIFGSNNTTQIGTTEQTTSVEQTTPVEQTTLVEQTTPVEPTTETITIEYDAFKPQMSFIVYHDGKLLNEKEMPKFNEKEMAKLNQI